MPWQRARYPAEWPAIAARIRARARNRCEWQYGDNKRCAAPHHAYIHRCTDDPEVWEACRVQGDDPEFCWCRELDAELGKRVRVVLTVAHLDHDPETCADDDRLAAWCQLHHLRYDAQHHARNAAGTRRRKRIAAGQQPLELFT